MADLSRLTLKETADGLAAGSFSSREVTDAVLAVAEKNAGSTHAYITIMGDAARAAADESDARRATGAAKSALDGIPLGIKDNMQLVGATCTGGSNILRDYKSPFDATVVSRLRAAGAVFTGKLNMDEFAMGGSTETSCFGVSRNPWNTEKIAGGSSGGSAIAVAEGSAIATLGSDTGGSIRQPAAMCGTVGLKPTYGRVSRYGLSAMASSLDQIGPVTRTVEDAAMLLTAIEGRDMMDSTSVALTGEQALHAEKLAAMFAAAPEAALKGLRIGLPKEYFAEGIDKEVEERVRAAIVKMEELGAEVREISLPNTKYALAVYYVLMPSEVSANLSRLDGIRYGTRVTGDSLEDTYRQSRGQGFGKEVRRRIMVGTYALSSGYYDAYYLKALKVRRLIADDFAKAFRDVDVIATPTSPVTAWGIGEKTEDPLSMYLADIYTVSVNVAGLPGISVPCGFAQGLPVGLQLIGKHFDETTLLRAANAYEKAAGWTAKMVPPATQ